jgi:hypothetical protein
MALEKEVIVDKLKEEGISETLGNGLSFETDEELTSWVDAYKTGLPAPEKALKDYTKEELEEIAKDPQFKGAKGLQGLLDSVRQKGKTPTPTPTPKQKEDDATALALKAIQEKLDKIEGKEAVKEFDNLVSRLGKAESLNDTHIARVRKSLENDATEAEIKAEITAYKKEMADLGIKDFGTPGGGGKRNSSNVGSLAKKWADQEKKKKK